MFTGKGVKKSWMVATAVMAIGWLPATNAASSTSVELLNGEGVTILAVDGFDMPTSPVHGVSPTDNILDGSGSLAVAAEDIQAALCAAAVTRSIVISPTDNIVISPTDNIVISPTDNIVISPTDNKDEMQAARTIVISPTDNIVISPTDNIVISPTDNKDEMQAARTIVISPTDNIVISPTDNKDEDGYRVSWDAEAADRFEEVCTGDGEGWVVVTADSQMAVLSMEDLEQGWVVLDDQSSLTAELVFALLDRGVYMDELDLDAVHETAARLVGNEKAVARAFALLPSIVRDDSACPADDEVLAPLCEVLH